MRLVLVIIEYYIYILANNVSFCSIKLSRKQTMCGAIARVQDEIRLRVERAQMLHQTLDQLRWRVAGIVAPHARSARTIHLSTGQVRSVGDEFQHCGKRRQD